MRQDLDEIFQLNVSYSKMKRVKRNKEKTEARKREGVWSSSRKGLKMSCGHCSARGHNQRRCPSLKRRTQPAQNMPGSASQNSQEFDVFMPTPGFVASSSQQTSHSTQHTSQSAASSNSKRNGKESIGASKRNDKESVGASRSKKNVNQPIEPKLHVAPSSAVVDTDEDESEEDDQPVLKLKRISEAKSRLQAKKMQQRPTGTRRIEFKGDENGVTMPTNLPYSPRKLVSKGKEAMTSNQLTIEKEKRIGKLMAKRGGKQ